MANIIRKTVGHEFTVSNSWLATKNTFAKLECGHFAHVCEGHDTANIKSEYPCSDCGDVEAKRQELLNIKATNNIHHTRARYFMGHCYVTVYAYDKTSPSNFIRVAGYPDIPELADIFTGSLSPLAPHEMA